MVGCFVTVDLHLKKQQNNNNKTKKNTTHSRFREDTFKVSGALTGFFSSL